MASANETQVKAAESQDAEVKPAPMLAQHKRKRNQILFMVMLSVALTYLARVNLSVSGHAVQQDAHFSTVTMGWVFSAFLLGCALMQVPSGWAADRFGPRRVVTVAVLVWAVFTALTGLVTMLPLARWIGVAATFMLIRFMVGVGEAACFPSGNKFVANWMGSGARHRRIVQCNRRRIRWRSDTAAHHLGASEVGLELVFLCLRGDWHDLFPGLVSCCSKPARTKARRATRTRKAVSSGGE